MSTAAGGKLAPMADASERLMVAMTPMAPERQVIQNAVVVACRAPSLHNSQPWRWVADGAQLHLFADRGRLVQAADRTGRELILSCGAALDHLRVAMAAAGWDAHTTDFRTPMNTTTWPDSTLLGFRYRVMSNASGRMPSGDAARTDYRLPSRGTGLLWSRRFATRSAKTA
jgi:hypothetical protein